MANMYVYWFLFFRLLHGLFFLAAKAGVVMPQSWTMLYRLPALTAPLFLFIVFSQPIVLFSPDHISNKFSIDK